MFILEWACSCLVCFFFFFFFIFRKVFIFGYVFFFLLAHSYLSRRVRVQMNVFTSVSVQFFFFHVQESVHIWIRIFLSVGTLIVEQGCSCLDECVYVRECFHICVDVFKFGCASGVIIMRMVTYFAKCSYLDGGVHIQVGIRVWVGVYIFGQAVRIWVSLLKFGQI